MAQRPEPQPAIGAVAGMAAAVLALELAFTRITAAVLQFQFTFIVITLGVTGLGVGALLAAGLHGWRSRRLTGLAFAPVTLAVIEALPVVVRLQDGRFWATGLVLVPPFVLAGHFLTATFRAGARRVGILYAVDLAGAATGCLLAGAAMNAVGPVSTARLAALVGGASAFPYVREFATRRGRRSAGAFALALLPLLLGPAPALPAASSSGRPSFSTQPFIADANARRQVVRTYWDAFARTDVVRDPDSPERLQIYTNGNVPSTMYRVPTALDPTTGPATARAALDAGGLPGAAALPFLTAPPDRVLSVGPGGGLDLLLAIAAGARQVDAVDVNPSIPRMLRDFAAFNGRIAEYPTVRWTTDDARHFVERTDHRYDLVFSALTQTGVGAASMVLPESHFSTRQGFEAVWRKLAPEGRLALVFHNPAYAYRALATAAAFLGATAGFSDADVLARAVLLYGDDNPYRVLLIMQKQPVSTTTAVRIAGLAAQLGLRTVHLPPARAGGLGRVLGGEITLTQHLAAVDRSVGVRSREVATDDRPYFLDLDLQVPGALTALLLTGLAGLGLVAGRAPGNPAGRLRRRSLLLAAGCTGAGFMIFELQTIGGLARSMGDPTAGIVAGLVTVLSAGSAASLLIERYARSRPLSLELSLFPAAAAFSCLVVGSRGGFPVAFVGGALSAAPLLTLAALVGLAAGAGYAALLCWAGGGEARLVPWLWAANTAGSLIGGVAAVAAPRIVGVGWVWQVAAGCFALAAALSAVRPAAVRSGPRSRAHRGRRIAG